MTELRGWWLRHGRAVLLLAVASMAVAAVWRIGNELPALILETGGYGAFDLQLWHRGVQRWFAGLAVYGEVERGDYPPASYVLLWPLLGWLELAPARLLWAITALGALAWFAVIAVRESTANTRLQVIMIGLLPFSTYGTAAALRLGQIGNHVLPLLAAGLLLLYRGRGRWRDDLLAAALLLPVLVKPTLTAAFFWIVCFVPGRIRPIALITSGYLALTLFALRFQPVPLAERLFGWVGEPPQVLQGHANIQKWLALVGLEAWMMPATVALLAALAIWVYRHRTADPWILIGVSALVARLFIHHRLYDDMLILLPMITLFRIARHGARPDDSDVRAGLLFAAAWITVHAPARWLQSPLSGPLLEAVQSVVWIVALGFLVRRARESARGSAAPEAAQSPAAA